MKNFKITIPKPCHEDWNTMSPNEKGRFCGSCSKTVVDFTQKSAKEVQKYFLENRGKRVCGHFKRKQLNSIVIQIPEVAFTQQLSFHKLFLLALVLAMGTTLFSCKTDEGKLQKIEKVELIDTIIKVDKVIDTIKQTVVCPSPEKSEITGDIIALEGETIIEEHITTGLPIIEVIENGEIVIEEIPPYHFNIVAIPPKFKGTKSKNKEELRIEFNKKMNDFVTKNFDEKLTNCLDLSKGKHRIYTQFTIDLLGNVLDIKTRAPHIKLKEHMHELIKKLPQFIPAKQNGKNVSVRYNLPIIFFVE